MDFYKELAIDEKKANEGKLIAYPGSKNKFLIARHSNRAFKAAISAAVESQDDSLSAEAKAERWKDITIDIMAKTLLLGWEPAVTFNGEELAYSVENAKKLLSLELFRNWVDEQARREQHFKAFQEESDVKN